MQTGQVQNIASGLMYTSKNASVKSTDNSFEQLMQLSQSSPVAEVKEQKEPVVTVEETKPEETVQATEEAAVTTEDAVNTGNSKLSAEEKAVAEKEASDIEAAELVASLLQQVTELVQDALGISEGELNAFMEQMGITSVELLYMETLQNLYLVVKQQDAVMLLTDAELFGQMQQLVAQVETVFSEAGVTPEELTAMLAEPDFEAMVQNAVEELASVETENATMVEPDVVVEKTDHVVEESEDESVLETTSEKSTTILFRAENRQTENDRPEAQTTENGQYAEQFVQNMQKTVAEVGDISGTADITAQIREIADQILERIKVTITPEITSMDIVLTPEELGRVNLTVTEQDGVMKASFVTESEVAKEAIESNLIQFKEMLNEQGLKVDSIEVAVGNFEFDKNGEAKQSGQEEKKNSRHHFDADAGVEQVTETDQLAQHFMDGGESTVNYMV